MAKRRQDKLFHKRKARTTKELQRKAGKREPYDRVLIVCEGAKTEPLYVKQMCNDLRLSSANLVVVDNTQGSAPINVVERAMKEYKSDPYFNRIYCIFDKDRHDSFGQACEKIRDTKLRGTSTMHAITSVPCFEFWLLLHFEYTTKDYYQTGKSACDKLISDLKEHIPGYEKGEASNYETTKDLLKTAINNAQRLEVYCNASGKDNPSTQMHHFVEYLIKLKEKADRRRQSC